MSHVMKHILVVLTPSRIWRFIAENFMKFYVCGSYNFMLYMFVELNAVSSMFAGKDGRITELLEVAVYVLLKTIRSLILKKLLRHFVSSVLVTSVLEQLAGWTT